VRKNKKLLTIVGAITFIAAIVPIYSVWKEIQEDINPPPPPLSLTLTELPDLMVDEQGTFSATASGGTSPYVYTWNFGDGETANGQDVKHVYSDSKTYTVTLTVTDKNGQSATSGLSTIVTEGTPDLKIIAFNFLPGNNAFGFDSPIGADPTRCGGFQQPDCNYGFISGTVVNVGNGKANDCQLLVRQSLHITAGPILEGIPQDQEDDLTGGLPSPSIDGGGSQEFSLRVDLLYTGDYKFTGQVVCSNGISDKAETQHQVDLEN